MPFIEPIRPHAIKPATPRIIIPPNIGIPSQGKVWFKVKKEMICPSTLAMKPTIANNLRVFNVLFLLFVERVGGAAAERSGDHLPPPGWAHLSFLVFKSINKPLRFNWYYVKTSGN